ADGPDALDIGAAVIVDDDDATVDLDAELFQPEIFGIGLDADRRDQHIGGNFFLFAGFEFDMGGDAGLGLVDLGNLGVGQDRDAALFEALAGEAGDFGVLDGHNLGQQLDDGHLSAQRAVEGRELNANGAGAHDGNGFGHFRGFQGLEISPDLLAVRF